MTSPGLVERDRPWRRPRPSGHPGPSAGAVETCAAARAAGAQANGQQGGGERRGAGSGRRGGMESTRARRKRRLIIAGGRPRGIRPARAGPSGARQKKGEGRGPPLLPEEPARPPEARLEVQLDGELDDAAAALRDDLPEVVERLLGEAGSRRVGSQTLSTVPPAPFGTPLTVTLHVGLQRQVEVVEADVVGRVGLVEDVERTRPELQLAVAARARSS